MSEKIAIPVKFVCVGESVYRIYLAPDHIWGEEIGGDKRLSPSEARRVLGSGEIIAEDVVVCKVAPVVSIPGKAPVPIKKMPKANAVVVGDQIIPLQKYQQYYSKYETTVYVPYSE